MAVRDSVLLGRDAELERLDDRLSQLAADSGGVVAVVGPAGIGKSALLDVVLARAARLGFAVARARGGELEQAYPFGVTRQLLACPALAGPAAAAAAELAGAPAAAALAPMGSSHGPAPNAGEFAVFETLWSVLAEAGSARPLVVVVDDLHWADQPSLRWFAFLARRLAAVPALVVGGSRPVGHPGDAERLHAVLEHEDVELIRPRPLDAQAVGELVDAELGGASDEFVRACHAATGGNPFHLRELLGAARRAGLDSHAAPAAISQIGPDSVARDVIERCAGAGDDALALAEAVAVLGEHATLRHVAAMTGLEPATAGLLVDALARLDVLRPAPPLGFVHPVLRAAVAGSLEWGRRNALHSVAAELLMDEGADPSLVAVHLLETEPAGDARRADALRAAADAAAARGAPEEALRLLERARAEPPPVEVRAEYDLDIALLEAAIGRASAQARLQAAIESDLPVDRRRRAAYQLAILLWLERRIDELTALCRTAMDWPDDGSEQAAQLPTWLYLVLDTWAPERASEIAAVRTDLERRRTAGSQVAATALAAVAVQQAARALRPLPEFAARMRATAERAEPLAESDPLVFRAFARSIARSLARAGEEAIAQRLRERLWEQARRTGSPVVALEAHVQAAWHAYDAGDLEIAAQHVEAGAERVHGTGLVRSAHTVGAYVFLAQGRFDEADAVTADAEAVLDDHAYMTLPARALLRLAQRRPHDALRDIDRAVEIHASKGLADLLYVSMPFDAVRARALHALGQSDEARALAAHVLERAHRLEDDRVLGSCLTLAGEVESDPARAGDLFAAAVAALERVAAPLELAQALLGLGSATRRAGRPREAREPLRRALDLATGCGAAPLAEQARAELVMAGARPRRDRLTGAAALTEAQRRVAWLAADGLSNPEIARALFLTRKTVEKTLTVVYRTLGVRSREDLAGALRGAAPTRDPA